MKKLLCAVLTASLILSLSIMAAYADSSKGKSDNSNGKSQGKNTEAVQTTIDATNTTGTTEDQSADKQTTESLKEQLKNQHKDKNLRLELIRQIYELKKQNKDDSKMIFVDGQEVTSDVPPVLKDGRTLIPVRAITNALGATVQWDEATNTATITKGTTVIQITLGSKTAIVNGNEVALDVPAEIFNNRTIVPVRFIAETFQKSVDYDEGTGTVIIDDSSNSSTDTTSTGTTTTPTTGTDTTTGTGTTSTGTSTDSSSTSTSTSTTQTGTTSGTTQTTTN